MKKLLCIFITLFTVSTGFAMLSTQKPLTNGRTALTSAILSYRLSPELAKAYLSSINEQNDLGWTVLHLAASTGYKEGITILIAAGADRAIKNNEGKTAQNLFDEYNQRRLRMYDYDDYPSRYDQSAPIAENEHTASPFQAKNEKQEVTFIYRPNSTIDLSKEHSSDGWRQQEIKHQDYASMLR